MKTNYILLILLVAGVLLLSSCDKHTPPSIAFKTGTGYTSGDAAVAKGAPVKVGITASKKEDDMKTYNISFAYDGASSTTTKALTPAAWVRTRRLNGPPPGWSRRSSTGWPSPRSTRWRTAAPRLWVCCLLAWP